jgi:DNA-binding NarL/FixJ family response regulator
MEVAGHHGSSAALSGTIEARTARRALRTAAARTAAPRSPEPLSAREREVLIEVASGWSNTEIGERLYISAFTAKAHVSSLLTKLGARGRAQLVMIAYETGLLTPAEQLRHRR